MGIQLQQEPKDLIDYMKHRVKKTIDQHQFLMGHHKTIDKQTKYLVTQEYDR